MPCILTKTNTAISPEQEAALKAEFGKAIALIPGKSENWLMLSFEDHCRMYFQGESNDAVAFVEVKLFGKGGGDAYEKLTAALTGALNKTLQISPSKIYVKYEETAHWGWNGNNL